MQHPRVNVTDLEARLGSRHTARTLALLRARYPGVHFVWLMGADNLATLHHWQDWESILGRVPVAVFARPGASLPARCSTAARVFREARVPEHLLHALPRRAAPAWAFVNLPLRHEASSALRAAGDWKR